MDSSEFYTPSAWLEFAARAPAPQLAALVDSRGRPSPLISAGVLLAFYCFRYCGFGQQGVNPAWEAGRLRRNQQRNFGAAEDDGVTAFRL